MRDDPSTDYAVVIRGMKHLASDSAKAVDRLKSNDELFAAYANLRREMQILNGRYQWATSDEFETQLPSVEGLLQIEALEQALKNDKNRGKRPETVERARVTEALTELGAWAAGVSLAYETLSS
jgi:hypothetical protein